MAELAAAQRAVTPAAHERRLTLAQAYIQRLHTLGESFEIQAKTPSLILD